MATSYIVFDLEWNQSYRGKVGKLPDLPFEIIEVGAVKLNENLEPVSEFSRFVRPFVYTTLDYRVRALTKIQAKQLRSEGQDFPTVMRDFFQWCGMEKEEEVFFCSWGDTDLLELQRNLQFFCVRNPFSYPLFYYDVQKLYGRCFPDAEKRVTALSTAVEALGLKKQGAFHRAIEDARYTAAVLAALPFDSLKVYRSLDYYRLPANEAEELYLCFPDYAKYVSRVFPDRESAIRDKTVTDMLCYRCNRMLKKKLRWFSANQRNYYCLALCPEHGFLRGKLRFRKTEGTKVYCIKTTKIVNAEAAERLGKMKQVLSEKQSLQRYRQQLRKKS